MTPCSTCGTPFTRRGNRHSHYYYQCPACVREKKRLYRLAHSRASKVEVVSIADRVRDAEQRWYLSGFVGRHMSCMDFRLSLEDGTFDGLVIEQNSKRYEIRGTERVEAA